tara:strand:+ start:677 stop:877 length:201 start_codon:yes stop_codon:yes gene_type:complete
MRAPKTEHLFYAKASKKRDLKDLLTLLVITHCKSLVFLADYRKILEIQNYWQNGKTPHKKNFRKSG